MKICTLWMMILVRQVLHCSQTNRFSDADSLEPARRGYTARFFLSCLSFSFGF
eukprot:m.525108 g.525108  ORF g.525108 m.525108 type:complete len:53 (+) comp57539_c0_seq3:850-1008(+)